MSIIDDMQQRGNRLIPQSEIDRMKRESRAMSEAMERQLPIEEQRRRRGSERTPSGRRGSPSGMRTTARNARRATPHAKPRGLSGRRRRKRNSKSDCAAYFETPGATEAGFAKVWPKLLEQHQIEQTIAAVPTRERLVAEFKALRGSGPDFYERPLPQPIEE